MIQLLRAGALLVNVSIFVGVPLLLGLAWPWACVVGVAFFVFFWWAAGRVPARTPATAEVEDAARRAAVLMGCPPPRSVSIVPGWTAAAVRVGRGYALLVGSEIAATHREAVLAHEMAHHLTGDLFWEPFTDGPARVILETTRPVPLLGVTALPFLLLGAPLARATELRADCLATDAIPAYPAILREVAAKMGSGAGPLYPSLADRIRISARDSNVSSPGE